MNQDKEKKLLVSMSLLPVLADFLEDIPFRHEAKRKANLLINSIRSFDEFFMDSADPLTVEQQDLIQRGFREFVKENFN